MLEIILAGGWMMVPILGCSTFAVAIIIERFWTSDGDQRRPPTDLDRAEIRKAEGLSAHSGCTGQNIRSRHLGSQATNLGHLPKHIEVGDAGEAVGSDRHTYA